MKSFPKSVYLNSTGTAGVATGMDTQFACPA